MVDADDGLREVERGLAAYYDQEAADRADRPLEQGRLEARQRFVAMLGGERPRLLEIGPGAGRDTHGFISDGFEVVGVDLSHEQLTHARERGLHPVAATARQLPFPDAAFDALWTMSTLMHVPNSAIEATLDELRRVLAPGTLAAIGVWGGTDREDFGDKPDRYDPPRLFSRRSDQRWQRLLTTLGTIEMFENWHPESGDFWYQWAVVRR